jgi:hypothetical protein
MRRRLVGLLSPPSGPELRLIHIIAKFRLPARYVGDGLLPIDGKCPDFIGTEDERAIIQVYGSWYHPSDHEDRDRQFFSERGYRLLAVWEPELTYPKRDAERREVEIARRLREFLTRRSEA